MPDPQSDNTASKVEVEQQAQARARSLHVSYLVAVVIMAALAVISVLVITLARPKEDNTSLIGMVMGAIVPTTVALLALLRGGATEAAVQEVHIAVNSRLSQLLAATAAKERAEGQAEGAASNAPPPAPPAAPVLVSDPRHVTIEASAVVVEQKGQK